MSYLAHSDHFAFFPLERDDGLSFPSKLNIDAQNLKNIIIFNSLWYIQDVSLGSKQGQN